MNFRFNLGLLFHQASSALQGRPPACNAGVGRGIGVQLTARDDGATALGAGVRIDGPRGGVNWAFFKF